MKKFYLLLLFSCWAHLGWAQRPGAGKSQAASLSASPFEPISRWQEHADSIFQHLDRSAVSTGLLANYGFAFKNYNLFQGAALTDNNLLQNLGEWRLLYAAMQMSTFNANKSLPSLRTANARISLAEQQAAPGAVSIATLLVRYHRFTDDAGTAGLVTVGNRQLYDAPNRPRSPYEQRTLVTLSPLASKIATRSPVFSFPTQLRFTNAAPAITALEFDAGEGQGFRAAAWDQPLGATYPANGTYTLRFRLSCADGSVLLSQARLDINQPPAARYQPTGSANVVTRPSSALFTDTRSYAPANPFLPIYAATGTVTVAYADGNTTGTIRKPLIVIEGYDPSKALRAKGVNGIRDYDYNAFAFGRVFGGILIDYSNRNAGDRFLFNDQLHEVGQYDLIFLNFDNGTDFIQRNALLAERLIQWVNDTKQPLNGVRQQNIVMGMSMGGLVARYALRDMEKRQAAGQAAFSHDTRLYVSHEAPHQGANVPLGIQYMVKGLAAKNLGFGLTFADLSPELGGFASLLNEPATQQLLLYQTDATGTDLHNNWLNEYIYTMGYPTQCRNVATSGGSECGRPQGFAPYAELLNIQGSGLLDEPYNGYANAGILALSTAVGLALTPFVGPAALFAGVAAGFALGVGNFEAKADFVVNALPNQQTQRIYHGKLTICKDILFGVFSTCLVKYSEDKNSAAYMLPYDNAPGGIYDIDEVSGGLVGQIGTALPLPIARVFVQPKFCFVPTTSALDIGGGIAALGPQDLTASYSSVSPPTGALATPFANFVTASRENLSHILWNGLNSKWAFQEMQGAPQVFNCQAFCQTLPTVVGNASVCASETFSLSGPVPGASIQWRASPSYLVTSASGAGPTFVATTTGSSGVLTLTATVTSECGMFSVERRVYVGAPEYPNVLQLEPLDGCNNLAAAFQISNYNPADFAYTLTTTGGLRKFGGIRSDGTFTIKAGSTGGSVLVTATNTCGGTTSQTDIVLEGCGAYAYTLSPNPAADEVQVQETGPEPTAKNGGISSVRVYDGYGRLRLERPGHGARALRLPLRELPDGLYTVHVLRGNAVVSRQRLQITR